MSTQENDVVQVARHTCGKVQFVVKLQGIEIQCRCGSKRLYTWREVLAMMLAAELARNT